MGNKDKAKDIDIIGRATFKDFDSFITWSAENAGPWHKDNWPKTFYPIQNMFTDLHACLKNLDSLCKINNSWYRKDTIDKIKFLYNYSVETGVKCPVFYSEEIFSIIQFGGNSNRYIIPTEFLNIEYFIDYSNIPIDQLKLLKGGNIPSDESGTSLSTVTMNDIKGKVKDKQQEITLLNELMKEVEQAQTAGLAEIQRQIEKLMEKLENKKKLQLAELSKKMHELAAMKNELEEKIFLLDSEIYSIRCFLGETVNFIPLRMGLSAKTETPVVLYQKVRFLDEELGRIAGIYNVEYGSYKQFEELIKYNQTTFEMFCPAEKCVSLVKVSRSGSYFSAAEGCKNILQSYEMCHGHMIGILIRSGENLFFGWTDDNRISFNDNMFFTPEIIETQVDDNIPCEHTSKSEFASRYFVFSILQGALEMSKLLSLPGEQSFFIPSKYVIYSAAENWLTDYSYPTLQELAEKYNPGTKVGDKVFVLLRLSDSGKPWYAERGRKDNDRNRTHDCDVSTGLHIINLIDEGKDKRERVIYDEKGSPVLSNDGKGQYAYEIYYEPYKYYYILAKKSWSYHDSNSNFRVEPYEFVNIQFLSSDCIKYYITNGRLGSFRLALGHQGLDYAYMIQYLNHMYKWALEREAEAELLITTFYPALSEVDRWRDKLMEWMHEKGVRNITEYQAKRFAKHLESI